MNENPWPGMPREAMLELTEIYSRGLSLCQASARLNGDNEAAAYRHFRNELRVSLLLKLLHHGVPRDEAEDLLTQVISLASGGNFGAPGHA